MEDVQLLELWQSYQRKLDRALAVSEQNAQAVTKMKIKSLVGSTRPVKWLAVLTGLLWVLAIDSLLIRVYPVASLFFMVSAGLQSLLTKIAIGIYVYQLVLIQQVDILAPVAALQARVAKLTASTRWVARILFLQLPLWTTFYLHEDLLDGSGVLFYLVQGGVTLLFCFMALWLFVNINPQNQDKRWFRLLFSGKEWTPVMEAEHMLADIEEIKKTGLSAG